MKAPPYLTYKTNIFLHPTNVFYELSGQEPYHVDPQVAEHPPAKARYYPAPFGPALCAALEKVALGGQSAPETVLSSFGRPRVLRPSEKVCGRVQIWYSG